MIRNNMCELQSKATVGLAFIIAICRHYKTTNLNQVDSMKG